MESGEEPDYALARELGEELDHPLLVAELLAKAQYRRRFRLSAEPATGDYDLYVFEAAVDTETFNQWARDVQEPGVVREGLVALLEPGEMVGVLSKPLSFLASHQEVIAALVPAIR